MTRRIAFVVTEDWFFASHFLPMAVAAREMGLAVDVIARIGTHRAAIEAVGARAIGLDAERRSLNPMAAGYAAGRLAGILKEIRPDILHCIALRSILVGGAAAAMAGVRRRVYAPTGFGYLAARPGPVGALARRAVRLLVADVLRTSRTRFLFENPDDPALLGLDPADPAVTLVGGAGIDPEEFRLAPYPPLVPLRVAMVGRMLWSKGVDLAVEAVTRARADGAAIELALHGAPDPSNPRSVSEAQLREWGARDGIAWHGPSRDVPAIWRDAHVALLPSRGGEGLPRALLEAASCGRPIVTTDVPGCRRLVRDGQEGFVVPPDDPQALADALKRFARSPELVTRMGADARLRVLHGFTERDVMDDVKGLWSAMLTT